MKTLYTAADYKILEAYRSMVAIKKSRKASWRRSKRTAIETKVVNLADVLLQYQLAHKIK